MEKIERTVKIDNSDYYITFDEVKNTLKGLHIPLSFSDDLYHFLAIPLHSKILFYQNEDSEGFKVIKRGSGKLVYITFPIGDPAYFYRFLCKENLEKELSTKDWYIGKENAVIYTIKCINLGRKLADGFAEAINAVSEFEIV